MSCWANGLVDRPAGVQCTDASPEPGDSSTQEHKSYNDVVSAESGQCWANWQRLFACTSKNRREILTDFGHHAS